MKNCYLNIFGQFLKILQYLRQNTVQQETSIVVRDAQQETLDSYHESFKSKKSGTFVKDTSGNQRVVVSNSFRDIGVDVGLL